jgi:hypothetical protein
LCLGFSKQKEIDMQALFKPNFISAQRHPQQAPAHQPPAGLAAAGGAIHLKKHQHLRMHTACGWTVHAMAGTVWITQDGDIRDIVLEAGESFVLDRDRDALVSSVNDDDAEVSLERRPCRQPAQSRIRKTRPSHAILAGCAAST